LLITNCKIAKVETANQELKDGETKCTTIAHVTGTLTRELAEVLCGRDGAAALFSRMSWLKSGPVSRESDEGAVSVDFHNPKDKLHLPSCGVVKYHVNGMTEKVSFRVNCERGADLLFAFHNSYPAWQGDVEIKALQGEMFADEPEAEEHTDDEGGLLFRGSQEEMVATAGVK
jgi:hypothetical protein